MTGSILVRKNNRQGVLLVELLVALLSFMLAATVLLECFAAAAKCSETAEARSAALAEAQNIADGLAVSDKTPAEWLADCGFDEENTLARADYTLRAELNETETLTYVTLTAERGGEALVTLPCARFMPKEAE